ncbi:MAG TPA: hypothetical protein VFU28_13415, partial [Vicinamibacterales bacterium]|nr:hypothetical protein [Vicinamibacterales bacterium]
LAHRLRDARVSVYAACALLAAAVAEIYLFFLWPASFSYVATVDQEFIRQLAATVSVAAGCVFTLLLLVVFIPVWVIHAKWIDAAADNAHNGEGWDREKWLKKFDLRNTSLSWLGPALSTLAPALLGLIPKLLASSQ